MSNERWLKQRKNGIGASDAPDVFGLRGTPYELQQEKLSTEITEKTAKILKTGKALEGGIIQLYEGETGYKVRRGGSQLLRSKKKGLEFMTVTPDGTIISDNPKIGIEAKMCFFPVKGEWGEQGTDEIPAPYLIQCQHHLSVRDYLEEIHVPVLMFGYIRIYRVKRNPTLIKIIEDKEKEFWEKHILRMEPVPVDFNNEDIQRMIMHRPAVANKVTLELDQPYYLDLAREYLRMDIVAKEASARCKAIKAEITDAMNDASEALLPDGYRVLRSSYERAGYSVKPTTVFKTKILRGEHEI